jgi:hydroxymethylpyrimidine/phosphomethylpyrimidine kinase
MEPQRAYALSLAGLDPSGGAGLLADIKTLESHKVYGFGVCTALTVQTDQQFLAAQWMPPEQIISQVAPLLEKFPVKVCKIGIISNVSALLEIVQFLRQQVPEIRIVLDPVLKASAGYAFHQHIAQQEWEQVLDNIYLLTPNYGEAILLTGETNGALAAQKLSRHCAVLLKGGHHPDKIGWDTLYTTNSEQHIAPGIKRVHPKHGSGCVLSAAITAQLALGKPCYEACVYGKQYTEKFLSSHSSLLGYHS